MDLNAKYEDMIPIKYDGPNGMKPPIPLRIYPQFYNHLDGWDVCKGWRKGLPPYISKKQLEFHGYIWNTSYWEEMKIKITKVVGNEKWLIKGSGKAQIGSESIANSPSKKKMRFMNLLNKMKHKHGLETGQVRDL